MGHSTKQKSKMKLVLKEYSEAVNNADAIHRLMRVSGIINLKLINN
jgi:hypothetical protein